MGPFSQGTYRISCYFGGVVPVPVPVPLDGVLPLGPVPGPPIDPDVPLFLPPPQLSEIISTLVTLKVFSPAPAVLLDEEAVMPELPPLSKLPLTATSWPT